MCIYIIKDIYIVIYIYTYIYTYIMIYIYIHIKMLFPSETDGTISRSSAGHHLSYPNYIEAGYREDQVCWISPQT